MSQKSQNLILIFIRILSYINDINLIATIFSIEKNCKLLNRALKIIFERQESDIIQFNIKKTEFIHFSDYSENNKVSVSHKNQILKFKLKELIK